MPSETIVEANAVSNEKVSPTMTATRLSPMPLLVLALALPVVAQAAPLPEGPARQPALGKFDPYKGYRKLDHSGGWVHAMAFSPDGKYLAASAVRDLNVWDVATGKKVYNARQKVYIRHIAFSPDGKIMAFGGGDGIEDVQIYLVETTQFKEEVQKIGEKGATYNTFAFSPGGKTLITAGTCCVETWEVATGRKLDKLQPQTAGFVGAALSPDTKTLAVYTFHNETMTLWDTVTGNEIRRMDGPGLGKVAHVHMSFTADGKQLAAQASNRTIFIWDPATGKVIRSFGRHASPAPAEVGSKSSFLALSPDGKFLATSGLTGDHLMRVWELAGEQEIFRFSQMHAYFEAVAFSPDGKLLAVANHYGVNLFGELPGHQTPAIRQGPREARQPLAKPLPDELAWPKEKAEKIWGDLNSREAQRIDQATRTLRDVPAQALHLFRKRIPAVSPAEGKRVAELIKDLDHDEFTRRDNAQKELEKVAVEFASAFRDALADRPSVEVKMHLTRMLEAVEKADLPDAVLGQQRAVDLLEEMGTDEARQILELLAQGAPKARLTTLARSALLRLDRGAAAKRDAR